MTKKKKQTPKTPPADDKPVSPLVDGHPTQCVAGGEHEPVEDEVDGKRERYCKKCKDPMPLEESKPEAGKAKKKKDKSDEAKSKPQKRDQALIVGKLASSRDPRIYRTIISRAEPPFKRFVGIDLGTNCGITYADIVPGQPVTNARLLMGQWDLSINQYDSGILRHVRLQQFLSILSPDLIFFEDVKYDAPTDSFKGLPLGAIVARVSPTAEFFGGLKTTLGFWATSHNIPCQGIAITEVKRWITGKGNSSKVDVIKAVNARFSVNLDPEGYESSGADNIADSAALCGMAIETYSDGLTGHLATHDEAGGADESVAE
jgi:hypothetical protein